MATYKFVPNSLTGGQSIINPSNAYTDTDSTTMASIYNPNGNSVLSGFNPSVPPSQVAVSVTVKFKAREESNNYYCDVTLLSAPNGVALSDTVAVPYSNPPTVYTFVLTESTETILSYADTLCIYFDTTRGGYTSTDVYGAEVIVETEPKKGKNKIIYGGETLIDLTGDTATESDVASGKTFHLASGVQVTGTLASCSTATCATITSSSSREVTFTSLPKEPSWFIVLNDGVASSQSGVAVQRPFVSALYDGTNFVAVIGYSSSSSANVSVFYSDNFTFTYSSGTLTITVPSSVRVHNYSYTLYYL